MSAVAGLTTLPGAAERPEPGRRLPRLPGLPEGLQRTGADVLRHAGEALRDGSRALLNPRGARGAVLELGWMAAHLGLYPLGMAAEKARGEPHGYAVADLPPVQRGLLVSDVEAAGTPILLVHGMVDNRSIFTWLRRCLRRRGFGQVTTVNYSPFTSDVREAARGLAQRIEEVCADTGYERVHVVGHSLGGLIARYYVQRLGGHERVHTLVTLGSPHGGSRLAHLAPRWTLMRQLRPGSDLMAELASPAPACTTRFVAFWSDLDQLVVPARAAAVDHPDLRARNVPLRGVGHMSLPIDGRVVHEVATALAHLDADGGTVAAGVTDIRGDRRSPAPVG